MRSHFILFSLFLAVTSGVMASDDCAKTARYARLGETLDVLFAKLETLGVDPSTVDSLPLFESEIDNDASYQILWEKTETLTPAKSVPRRSSWWPKFRAFASDTPRIRKSAQTIMRVSSVYDADSDQVRIQKDRIQRTEVVGRSSNGQSHEIREEWSSISSDGDGLAETESGANIFQDQPSKQIHVYRSKKVAQAAMQGDIVAHGKVGERELFYTVTEP